ncbi:potassium channel family protein [Ekhidna sp.]|uniref:potassium channel family protein n=1 Tax=Ekhidna sp. TaxID=2608089 RepID=UPI003B50D3A4
MRRNIFLVFIIFSFQLFGQEVKIDTLSISELVAQIQSTADSVYRLENAYISINRSAESRYFDTSPFDQRRVSALPDSLIFESEVSLHNVYFDENISLNTARFNRDVDLSNVSGLQFYHCLFLGKFELYNIEGFGEDGGGSRTRVISSEFRNYVMGFIGDANPEHSFEFQLINNRIDLSDLDGDNPWGVILGARHPRSQIVLEENVLDMGELMYWQVIEVENDDSESSSIIINNQFIVGKGAYIHHEGCKDIIIRNNRLPTYVYWQLTLERTHQISWPDLANRIVNTSSPLAVFLEDNYADSTIYDNMYTPEVMEKIFNQYRVEMEMVFQREMEVRGQFIDLYKLQRNTTWANSVFIELKDLETERLAYLYSQGPTFRTYFKWKVNQFLKLFSDYGTEPSKAIVFGVYVIIFFAAIYLFFPNSWDSHGKNRILHRFGFFLKYVDSKAGMHEVYMEDKKGELLVYEDFKKLLHEKGQRVPRFFITAGFPLYRWAVSGSKISSWFLSRVDVLKGTWEETPKSKKWLKYVLVFGAFIIALLYDLFIKVLNAVMLSINTFTTLGFGEIPIKGLPRYLAIVQGFIGWFMLTIFSVSLISQLLN